MIEKDVARDATTVDVSLGPRHGDLSSTTSFTIIVNNRSGRGVTRGCIALHDAGSGDGAGVLFDAIPNSSSDGRTMQIAGLPEVVIIHFECGDPDRAWRGSLTGVNISNPVVINLT